MKLTAWIIVNELTQLSFWRTFFFCFCSLRNFSLFISFWRSSVTLKKNMLNCKWNLFFSLCLLSQHAFRFKTYFAVLWKSQSKATCQCFSRKKHPQDTQKKRREKKNSTKAKISFLFRNLRVFFFYSNSWEFFAVCLHLEEKQIFIKFLFLFRVNNPLIAWCKQQFA